MSCYVEGISSVATVTWHKDGVTDLLDTSGYTVDQGTFNSFSNEQRSYLLLTGDVNTEDIVYTCDVVPANGDGTLFSETMELKVYGRYY